MQETIYEKLLANYKDVEEKLSVVSKDDQAYEKLLKERDDIRNELIKLNQIDVESKGKAKQLRSEEKRDKIRNIGTWVVSGITFIGSCYWMHRSFKFDETSTMTSSAGRGFLANWISGFKK